MNKPETKEVSTQRGRPMFWVTARQELATRRASHAARKRLAAEMSDYTTPSDRNDLNALLDSYPDDQVTEIRNFLNQRVAV